MIEGEVGCLKYPKIVHTHLTPEQSRKNLDALRERLRIVMDEVNGQVVVNDPEAMARIGVNY